MRTLSAHAAPAAAAAAANAAAAATTTAAPAAPLHRTMAANKLQPANTLRLPSQLHAAAVASGLLVPDPHQASVLPILDALVTALPPHEARMAKHADQLRALEEMRAAAERRDAARAAARPWLHYLRRALAGAPTDAPPHALPNAYFRLPQAPPAPPPPRGLYLHGDVGCGKSLLMDLAFRAAAPVLASAARVHYHAFMASVYQMIHVYDSLPPPERARRGLFHPLDAVVGRLGRANAAASGAGLLCFDEFQVADVADARLMHGIFDRLLRSGTVVCFTANRAPQDVNRSQLRDADFVPFLDLLHERCQMLELRSGVDYRAVLSAAEEEAAAAAAAATAAADAGADAESSSSSSSSALRAPPPRAYFTADDEQSLRRAWAAATGGADWDDVAARDVDVAYGRTLTLARARPDGTAAQLTTEELLEAAVGASDYRALVQAVRAVFVSDVVPTFTSETRDLARRFITLVDVCYEQRVRLFMRMDAPAVDDLFARVDVAEMASTAAAQIAEGLQFETEVAKEGVGAENRNVSGSSLYTGEDEAFAFRRAISRLKEMQTAGFGRRAVDLML